MVDMESQLAITYSSNYYLDETWTDEGKQTTLGYLTLNALAGST